MRVTRALVFLVALSACKSKPPTDDKPADQLSSAQIEKERLRAANGELVGDALREPKVVVDAEQITINGYRVAARSELASAGKIETVQSVHAWCKDMREHWKLIHLGDLFTSAMDVTLPDDIAQAEAVRLLLTVAFAGYYSALTVHVGAVSATFTWPVPGPTPPDDGPERVRKSVVQIWSTADGWTERVARPNMLGFLELSGDVGLAWTLFWPDASVLPHECEAAKPISLADAGLVVQSDCAAGCDAIVVGGTALFRDSLAMAVAALSHNGRVPLSFQVDAPCTAVASSDKLTKLVMPPATVDGALPPEVIDRVVRKQLKDLHACFEAGLRTNPKLSGRVNVQFSIAATGAITNVTESGSDLPDKSVTQCVLKIFSGLSFPPPDKGTVKVAYPIVLPNDN